MTYDDIKIIALGIAFLIMTIFYVKLCRRFHDRQCGVKDCSMIVCNTTDCPHNLCHKGEMGCDKKTVYINHGKCESYDLHKRNEK